MLHSVSIGNHSGSKALSQLDLYGNVINTFVSIGQASRITGISWSTISKSIKEQKPCSKLHIGEKHVFKLV